MDRDEILAPAQHRTGIGAFEVLEHPTFAVGKRRDLFDPAGNFERVGGAQRLDGDPTVLAEVLDEAGTLTSTRARRPSPDARKPSRSSIAWPGRLGTIPCMLTTGVAAPELDSVVDHDGHPVRLADLRGRWVLLWWYPMADTPG